jgi:hypothetical protein
MNAQAGRGTATRMRTFGSIALLALVSSCECDENLAMAICQGQLRLESVLALNNIFASDEWDIIAALEGSTEGCGPIATLGLTWNLSNNLSIVQNLSDGVRIRALGPGAAFASASAPSPLNLSARLDWDVIRVTGDLNVTANVPDSGPVNYRVMGNGFDMSYTGSGLLQDLAEGQYQVEAIDVLRGPQGALYGASNATASVNITRNSVTNLTIDYLLKNALLEATFNVPAGVTGPFGRITGTGGFEYTFSMSHGMYGFGPGAYQIEAYDLDPQGYQFTPVLGSESLDLSLGVSYSRQFDFTPARGKLTVGTTGAPAGIEDKAKLIDPMGGTWDIMLPYTGFLAPGNWEVQNKRAVFEDAAEDRIAYYTPRIAGFQVPVTAGQDSDVQYEYDLTSIRTDWSAQLTVKLDTWNHKDFVAMPATMDLRLYEDQTSAGMVKVKGITPFATVTGTLSQNGDLIAQGTGVAAGFSNVPFTLTAVLDWTAGTLSGELEVGQETAPTGLPNGPITYSFAGVRVPF